MLRRVARNPQFPPRTFSEFGQILGRGWNDFLQAKRRGESKQKVRKKESVFDHGELYFIGQRAGDDQSKMKA